MSSPIHDASSSDVAYINRRDLLKAATAHVVSPRALGLDDTHALMPIEIVVPSPPGGALDQHAREFADQLELMTGQIVIVVSSPGASGVIAARKVLHSRPDGHTVLLGSANEIIVAPLKDRGSLGYDRSAFAPIARLGSTTLGLVARPDSPFRTASEFLHQARQHPGILTLGFTGAASLQALAVQELLDEERLSLIQVPYLGGPQLLNDLLTGQIDFAVTALPGIIGQVKVNKLRLIGLLSRPDSPAVLDLNAHNLLESVAGHGVGIWSALFAPAATPKVILNALHEATDRVLVDGAYRHSRLQAGEEPAPPESIEAFEHFLELESERYLRLLKL